MPTNRTPLKRQWRSRLVVTPEALAAYRACKAIRNKDSGKFKLAERKLQLACGLSKFESPIGPYGPYSLIGDATNSRRWAAALKEADAAAGRAARASERRG